MPEEVAARSQSPSGSSRANRALAVVLALMCGVGVGHAYAGLLRRAFFWAAVLVMCAVLSIVALVTVPARWSLLVFFAIWLCAWLAPLIDIGWVPLRKPSYIALVGFAIGMPVLQVALATTARSVFVEAFKIPSGGMMPTLLQQDHIFVDKRAYRSDSPKRGDIVVYTSIEHPEADFVHRVIAAAGDTVAFEDGRPLINGWRVPHCDVGTTKMDSGSTAEVEVEFLDGRAYLTLRDGGMHDPLGPWTLEDGELFVVGDNRDNSADSRTWFGGKGGGLPRANIKGRASQIWLGFSGTEPDFSRTGIALDSVTLPRSMEALGPKLHACLKDPPAQTIPPPPKPP
jgi:signal peptidase I